MLVMQPEQEGGPAAAAEAAAGAGDAGAAFSSFGPQLLAALLQLLQAEGLPAMGLWLAGWLLHQLLPAAEAPAVGGSSGGGIVPQRPAVPPNEPGEDAAGSSSRQSLASSRSSSLSSSCSSSSSDLSGDDDGSMVDTCGYTSRASSMSAAAASLDGAAPPPYVHVQQAASLLSPQQQQLVQAAVDAARADFARQLSGMWCEAVFPMLSSEWPSAREMMQRPVLRAGSEALLSGTAVWPLLVGLQQQQAAQQQQAPAAAARGAAMDALSTSARAGLGCYLAVQRVVALTQLQEVSKAGRMQQLAAAWPYSHSRRCVTARVAACAGRSQRCTARPWPASCSALAKLPMPVCRAARACACCAACCAATAAVVRCHRARAAGADHQRRRAEADGRAGRLSGRPATRLRAAMRRFICAGPGAPCLLCRCGRSGAGAALLPAQQAAPSACLLTLPRCPALPCRCRSCRAVAPAAGGRPGRRQHGGTAPCRQGVPAVLAACRCPR